jgi:hypothetical protein
MSTKDEQKDVACENFPTFARNLYFYGKLLSLSDFQMEQSYFVNKQRLINRLIHGAGVICGLVTSKATDPSSEIRISAGVALDSCGREIVVPSLKPIDLKKYLPSSTMGSVKVFLGYNACLSDGRQKLPETNSCTSDCCYSTLTESYRVVLNVNGAGPISTGENPQGDNVYVSGIPAATGSPAAAGPALQADPLTGPTGTVVKLSGSGFQPSQTYVVLFGSDLLATPPKTGRSVVTFTSTTQGTMSLNFTVPLDVANGSYYIEVVLLSSPTKLASSTRPIFVVGAQAIPSNVCGDWQKYLDKSSDKFCTKDCPSCTDAKASDTLVLLSEVTLNADMTIKTVTNLREIVYTNPLLSQLLQCQTGQPSNHAQPDFPKITEIGWPHDETFENVGEWCKQFALKNSEQSKLTITFNKPMNERTLNHNTVSLTLEVHRYLAEAEGRAFWVERIPIPISPVCSLKGENTVLTIKLATLDKTVRGLRKYFDENSIADTGEAGQGFLYRLRAIIEVKGDFVTGKNGFCLDGEHLRGDFKTNGTGNGVEGGTFESWFSLIIERDAAEFSCPKLMELLGESNILPKRFEEKLRTVLTQLQNSRMRKEDKIKAIMEATGCSRKVAEEVLLCLESKKQTDNAFGKLTMLDDRQKRALLNNNFTTMETLKEVSPGKLAEVFGLDMTKAADKKKIDDVIAEAKRPH